MSDIIVQQDGAIGRITLNRPKALNALTNDMVVEMVEALKDWADNPEISSVLVDGAGDRAFCAGGDIQSIYENGKENSEVVQGFWRREYNLNYLIETFPKPYIAIMDGFTMGGGIGVSAHGSHRIVTEKSVLSMPEVAIGFLPDVGGTWLLSRAPGKTGLYCGLTAGRLNAADAIYAGFADDHITTDRIGDFVDQLRSGVEVDKAIHNFASRPEAASPLKKYRSAIDKLFSHNTLLECVDAIWASECEFSEATFKALRTHSPFAMSATFYAIKRAYGLNSLVECLVQEYAYAHRCLKTHDLYEGIRAAVIDKDRNPKWNPANLDEVNPGDVEKMFAPLAEQALKIAP